MTTVHIENKKLDVLVPYGYELLFENKHFASNEDFQNALNYAKLSSDYFARFIIMKNREYLVKSQNYRKMLDDILNDAEYLPEFDYDEYDLRNDISTYEM
jgi:hypothetical protein